MKTYYKTTLKTGAFRDKECTCPECGNKHEFYGGKGHKTIACVGNIVRYYHAVKCNVCGATSELEQK